MSLQPQYFVSLSDSNISPTCRRRSFRSEKEVGIGKTLNENVNNDTYKEFQLNSQDDETKENDDDSRDEVGNMITLTTGATVFHQTLERTYPNYPSIKDIVLSHTELNSWLDLRPYMDTSPYRYR
jgi:hypothetical protein